MKYKKIVSLIAISIILILLAAACSKSASEKNKAYDTDTANNADYGALDIQFQTASGSTRTDSAEVAPTADDKADGLSSTSSITTGDTEVQPQDKIIRTFYLDVETQGFDSLITKLNSEIKRLNGYVETSAIKGKGYQNNGETRYGSIVARVPSDKVDEFVGTINEDANVVNQQESTENVSLQYIEAESRVETLKIEQERLFAILEKEINLENIITLESRLSDIRFELQNYETKIRYYDNQVAYSTVTLSVQEVEKLTPVTEEKQSVGTRMKNGLSDTMYQLSEGFKNFIVWFVINLPYLLIWGIIIAVAVLITRRSIKKSKALKAALPPPLMNYGQQSNENQNDTNQ